VEKLASPFFYGINLYMSDNTNEIASKYLGKRVSGSEYYDSALLVCVPREDNRKQYSIESGNLPFLGFDVWHAYEFSSMTENGVPYTRVMKLRYDCDNKFLIESKSLKLYLNSFNMSRFGKNIEDGLNICKEIIEKDLSEKLQTKVDVNFLDKNTRKIGIFSNFKNIMDFIDVSTMKADCFKEAPECLEVEQTSLISEYSLTFDSLRSNCRVTHQPDFGDVFIYYKSALHIKEESLLKYLISFRSEYHFHEECCEMIYKRLYDLLGEDAELFVCALYTRRGGIDICPARWSRNCHIEDVYKLGDINTFARCGIKQ